MLSSADDALGAHEFASRVGAGLQPQQIGAETAEGTARPRRTARADVRLLVIHDPNRKTFGVGIQPASRQDLTQLAHWTLTRGPTA